MNRTRSLFAAAITVVLGAAPAAAQLPRVEPTVIRQLKPAAPQRDEIPRAHRPPPGMCRVWLDGVPPGQQPAPTDCASAVRNRPANGRVIFGDDYRDGKTERRGRDTTKRIPGQPRPSPDSGGSTAWTAIPASYAPAAQAGAFAYVGARFVGASYARAAQDTVRRERPRERASDRDRELRERRRIAAERRRQQDRDRRDGARRDGARDDARRDDARREDARDDARRDDARRDDARRDDARRDDARRDDRDGARGDGRVIVVGPGGDPRYYDDRYAPPGRATGRCLDRDGDGWCDDRRYDAGTCLDRDGDGRCDDYGALATAPYSNRFPSMRAGADVRTGVGSAEALRWLGTAEVIARTTDLDRDGIPERIQWLDSDTGQLVQVWTDRDRDGVADRVEVYRNGQRVKLFGR